MFSPCGVARGRSLASGDVVSWVQCSKCRIRSTDLHGSISARLQLGRELRILVRVHLSDARSVAQLSRDIADHRSDHLTRPAPAESAALTSRACARYQGCVSCVGREALNRKHDVVTRLVRMGACTARVQDACFVRGVHVDRGVDSGVGGQNAGAHTHHVAYTSTSSGVRPSAISARS